MIDWRQWAYDKLVACAAPIPVHAGGSINGPLPALPALVYRLQSKEPRLRDGEDVVASVQTLEVWAYDEPGSYDRIDNLLANARQWLTQDIAEEGAVACSWTGDSPELSDDAMKAIVRNSTFRLIGATS